MNTGLAIANPNNQDVNVSFYFTNEFGQNFGASSTVIPANGQISRFLDGAPFNGGSPILGNLYVRRVRAHCAGGDPRLLHRTFRVSDDDTIGDHLRLGATDTIVLPHFADGGGFTTQFVLVNPRDDTLSGTLQFYSPGSVAPTNAAGIPVAVQIDGRQRRRSISRSRHEVLDAFKPPAAARRSSRARSALSLTQEALLPPCRASSVTVKVELWSAKPEFPQSRRPRPTAFMSRVPVLSVSRVPYSRAWPSPIHRHYRPPSFSNSRAWRALPQEMPKR